MNKKTRDFLNGLGLLAATIAVIATGIALIFLVHAVFHANSK